MVDLSKLGPKGLAAELGKRNARRHVAVDIIFGCAQSGHERFSEIVARLGGDHPNVVKYRDAVDAERAVESECVSRYGTNAVTYSSQWLTFLLVRG